MNSAFHVLLKALSNIEQNEKNIQNQIAACKKELAGWENDLSEALKSKEEIRTALSKLEKSNEDTSSKKTKFRRTTPKKGE